MIYLVILKRSWLNREEIQQSAYNNYIRLSQQRSYTVKTRTYKVNIDGLSLVLS